MVLGIYVFTTQSINGSIFFMVNHGFSSAALFLTVGFLIKRRGSADINDFGGVEKVAPVMAGAVLLAVAVGDLAAGHVDLRQRVPGDRRNLVA